MDRTITHSKLFYGDICGPCSYTERLSRAPRKTGRARSISSCVIFGGFMLRSQRSQQPSTIVLILEIWQSQQHCEYGLENISCPYCNCISQHVVRPTSLEQGKQARCCRSAHLRGCVTLPFTANATRAAEQLLYLQRKQPWA